MSGSVEALVPRLDALLIDRATQGLAPPEEAEVRELLHLAPAAPLGGVAEADAYELAAAALHLNASAVPVPMPSSIEAEVRRQAEEFFAAKQRSEDAGEPAAREFPGAEPAPVAATQKDTVEPLGGKALGWWAAAACLAFAVAGWWPQVKNVKDVRPTDVVTSGSETAELPAGVPESRLDVDGVAAAQDAVRLPWTATEDPAAADASGEVLWSTELQAGFMRFAGLEANDPEQFQYQLWIFDREQDERYPVAGGVFDVAAGGETLVPIEAKLGIKGPTLFAVTVEKPGGVVVSSRERIVLVAQVG